MIIFNLDGTLSCPEHRRHFVQPPTENEDYEEYFCPDHELIDRRKKMKFIHKITGEIWKPDWRSFYEACDKDKPIEPVIEILNGIYQNRINFWQDVEIWTGRCESVREKTIQWLEKNVLWDHLGSKITLRMRPIGDNTRDEVLKERWLDQAIAEGQKIEFVFDDRPKVVRMWKRRGIFVFNCLQNDGEF